MTYLRSHRRRLVLAALVALALVIGVAKGARAYYFSVGTPSGDHSYFLHADWTVDGAVKFAGITGPGLLGVDGTGNVSALPSINTDTMHFYAFDFNGLTTNTWMTPLGLKQESATTPPETRLPFTVAHVRLLVHNSGSPSISGCSTAFAISRNGSLVVASELPVTNTTSNNTFQDSGQLAISGASTDSWGVQLSTVPGSGTVCNFGVFVTALFYAQ